MADEFDAARIGIQLDRAEECGAIETDVAAAPRGPIRLPTPDVAQTTRQFGMIGMRFEWAVGVVIRTTPGTIVSVELRERGADYLFESLGRRFVVWMPR